LSWERARGASGGGVGGRWLAWIVAFAPLLLATGAAQPASMRSADKLAAERTQLAGESSSEVWELVGRFASGHLLFARVLVTNVGPGDYNAVAVGHLRSPDGTVHPFRKAKSAEEWRLSETGLRMEIGGSVVFDLRADQQRFHVARDGILVDLEFDLHGASTRSMALAGTDHGFDLLDAAGEGEATVQTRDMPEPVKTRGLVALTHRWMPTFESSLVQRRVEFFSLDEGAAIYFTEVTRPDGRRVSWIVVDHDGKRVERSEDVRASVRFASSDESRVPLPESLDFEGPGLRARVGRGTVLLSDDQLAMLPLFARTLVALHMKPYSVWSAAPFEITFENGTGQEVRRSGVGLTNVTYLNPGRLSSLDSPVAMQEE
jgi:hypothetical protein